MIDDRAARGFRAAENYDAHRPGYPPAAVTFIREAADLDLYSTVVDLGAGTGLMTRLLRPVGRLLALEPLAEMREILRERVPEAEIVDGTAEHMPLPSAVADAVVAAQAFHWFANHQAILEIARVLKPRGALFLVWNDHDSGDTLLAAVDVALAQYRLDSPRFETTPWREVLDADGSPLKIIDRRTYPSEEQLTLGHLKGRVRSYSYIAMLDDRAQAGVMHKLDEVTGRTLGVPVNDETPLVLKHVTEVFMAASPRRAGEAPPALRRQVTDARRQPRKV